MAEMTGYEAMISKATGCTNEAVGHVEEIMRVERPTLDALNPQYLTRIITAKVLEYRDQELWDEAVAKETEERDRLAALPEIWRENR